MIEAYKNINNKTYEMFTKFIATNFAIVLLILWSFTEASFWFVAPDFLIAIYCFFPKFKLKKFLIVAVISSLLGGILYWFLNVFNSIAITDILLNTPYVSSVNFNFVKELFLEKGVIATIYQAFTFIPFKIWTNLAVLNNFNPFVYFSLVVVSRFVRLSLSSLVALSLGKTFQKHIKNHVIVILLIYVVLFFTSMYWLEM